MPRAIGRSKRPESLGRSAGARFTVIFLFAGNSRPAFCSAERTRSRASFTSTSARPTNVKLGNPLARCTSTVTGMAARPVRARLCTKARLIAAFLPSQVRSLESETRHSGTKTVHLDIHESQPLREINGDGDQCMKKHTFLDMARSVL